MSLSADPVVIHRPNDLGKALRSARKALKLNQSDLAIAAGVGLRFVVELEAGKPTVRLEQVLRVIDALGGYLSLQDLPAPEPRPRRRSRGGQHQHSAVAQQDDNDGT